MAPLSFLGGRCSEISGNRWQLAMVEIEESLQQQTGLEVPLGSGHQECGRRLPSRVFHRPIKSTGGLYHLKQLS